MLCPICDKSMSRKKIACCKEHMKQVMDVSIRSGNPVGEHHPQSKEIMTNPGYKSHYSPNPLWNLA